MKEPQGNPHETGSQVHQYHLHCRSWLCRQPQAAQPEAANSRSIINKSEQSNFGRGMRRGAVAHVCPIGPFGQWHAPNSPPKVPLPMDGSPKPTTCLMPGPIRPTMQNAVFPQCTGQTDARTYVQTDRSYTGKFDDYRLLRSKSDAA